MKRALALAALTLSFASSPARAVSGYAVSFGPFIGTGSLTNDTASVKHASGYAFSLEKAFEGWLPYDLTLSPRLEIIDSLLSARDSGPAYSALKTYDNRIVALGASVGKALSPIGGMSPTAYVATSAGAGYSKLTVDRTDNEDFVQYLYSGLSGTYASAEIGTRLAVRPDFSIALALSSSFMSTDQGQATATRNGERNVDGKQEAVSGVTSARAENLATKVTQKIYAARLGVSLVF